MLQAFWLKPDYIVTDHYQAAASKMDGGHADNYDDANGSGEASQTTKDAK